VQYIYRKGAKRAKEQPKVINNATIFNCTGILAIKDKYSFLVFYLCAFAIKMYSHFKKKWAAP